MTYLPLVLRINQTLSNQHKTSISPYDELTIEDPLPTVLNLNENGYKIERSTRLTEVNQETTDDN